MLCIREKGIKRQCRWQNVVIYRINILLLCLRIFGGRKRQLCLWLPHDPVAIVIKQPDIAKTFKNYFDILWDVAKD